MEVRKNAFTDTKRQSHNFASANYESLAVQNVEVDEANLNTSPSRVRVYAECGIDVAITAVTNKANPILVMEMNFNYPAASLERGGFVGTEAELWIRSNFCGIFKDNCYPLDYNKVLYFPDVTVFKDNKYENMSKASAFPILGVVMANAPDVQYEQRDGKSYAEYSKKKDLTHLRNLVFGLFAKAVELGHDMIILPDLGCERGHPVDQITAIYNEAIDTFKLPIVCIAVLPYVSNPKKLARELSNRQDKMIDLFVNEFRIKREEVSEVVEEEQEVDENEQEQEADENEDAKEIEDLDE